MKQDGKSAKVALFGLGSGLLLTGLAVVPANTPAFWVLFFACAVVIGAFLAGLLQDQRPFVPPKMTPWQFGLSLSASSIVAVWFIVIGSHAMITMRVATLNFWLAALGIIGFIVLLLYDLRQLVSLIRHRRV
ncbi:hypothetical protein [Furfurilactobacillus siliginis]|uniref:Uncharacterized protein n=1 Tax=Furfurilactobacillus siliginis TaxID=348151 RepID=A0A0R2L5P6_9LACO|nr:hypothetical protein [Furfurilactobacillus siliginis]KRN96987.1 hypothetical protein IV55_GL000863 [Furfurilactobacillus siliginis]GEK27746.1 hypothetical protein LSI01_00570 [Furfurilactobacillus siliginis]